MESPTPFEKVKDFNKLINVLLQWEKWWRTIKHFIEYYFSRWKWVNKSKVRGCELHVMIIIFKALFWKKKNLGTKIWVLMLYFYKITTGPYLLLLMSINWYRKSCTIHLLTWLCRTLARTFLAINAQNLLWCSLRSFHNFALLQQKWQQYLFRINIWSYIQN